MTIVEAIIELRNDLKDYAINHLKTKANANIGTNNINTLVTINAEGNIIAQDVTIIQDKVLSEAISFLRSVNLGDLLEGSVVNQNGGVERL